MRKARLLLADDHAIFLEGLTRLLEPEFEVAGKAEDGRQMLEMSARLKPDVIVADISMPHVEWDRSGPPTEEERLPDKGYLSLHAR